MYSPVIKELFNLYSIEKNKKNIEISYRTGQLVETDCRRSVMGLPCRPEEMVNCQKKCVTYIGNKCINTLDTVVRFFSLFVFLLKLVIHKISILY